jgi:site-specific DNA-cytosine methylase
MTVRFISVLGFGGAFDLGATQAGLKMMGRKELTAGYGALNILANRHLLGYDWDTELAADRMGESWETIDANVVLGNPPCSGFSTLSNKSFRGEDSSINDCMWALVRYAARVKPEVVIFESVQQAFRQGRDLMAALRNRLEKDSGEEYTLYHVLHNNYSLGGCSIRRRYFFVAARVPFGMEAVKLDNVPVVREVFQDLLPLQSTWEKQPYRSMPSWWSEQMWDGTGTVDGHALVESPHIERVMDLVTGPRAVEWNEGEQLAIVCRRYYERYGDLPKSWYYPSSLPVIDAVTGEPAYDPDTGKRLREPMPKADVLIKTDFNMGFNQLTRWYSEKPARVITGGGCQQVLHPTLLRTITHREAARIQGFPDAWTVRPMRGVPEVGSTWGKGIPVHAGRWVSTWARESIEGRPGSMTGEPAPVHDKNCKADHHEREFIIDVTNDWQQVGVAPSS